MSLRTRSFRYALLALLCLQLHGWVHATHQLDDAGLSTEQSCVGCQLSQAGGTLQSHSQPLSLAPTAQRLAPRLRALTQTQAIAYREPIRGPPTGFFLL